MKWAFEYQGNLSRLHTLKSKPENQRTPLEQLIHTTDEYEGLLYKEVDRVIVLSRHMQQIPEKEYQIDTDKIYLIPNGLTDWYFQGIADQVRNDRAFQGIADHSSTTLTNQVRNDKGIKNGNLRFLRAKWNVLPKEKIILFAGRLDPVKGLSFLIKAFREVLEQFPNCRLVIAGSGNYDTYFREAKDICTKITFTGLLKKEELYELYQIADVGVVPSLYEPFGYVAVEMMMHGLPLVATATSGLNEVVDESCGLKVPITVLPDNVEIEASVLADRILYLVQHPSVAKKMGQNGRKRYIENYTSEVFRKNMLQFYNSLIHHDT